VRELVRAAAIPVACAVLLTGLLVAWVLTGGAGTLHRVPLGPTQVSHSAGANVTGGGPARPGG
jgi:hypothetical protein